MSTSKWAKKELVELLERKPEYGANAPSIPFIEGETPRLIRITDIDASGRLLDSPKVGIDSKAALGSEVSQGDILIARTGATVGKSVTIRKLDYPASFAGYLIRFVVDESKALRAFITQYLNSPIYWKWVETSQRAGAQPNINSQEYSALVISLPPLPEQQKIADILGTWDEALEKLDALIAAKARRKQALMQQLLTGHRRLPGFSKPWKQTRFGDLMKSEDRYADFDDDHLYHLVSARRRAEGVFFREALHGRDIKTKVMKQVRAGDFVISRMQVVHGGLGVVPPACEGYYASDSYEVLVPRDPALLSPRFIGHLCRTRRFWHHALVCSHGVHIEKMTFVMADFEHEKFMIPEFAEQGAIAAVLDTADAELRLLRQQRTALDHQKRGLMQQLLTGKARVAA